MSLIPSGFAKSAAAASFYDHPIEQSLRFNDDDSAYLSRTPSSAGNRKTWTWSGWVKRGNLDTWSVFFGAGGDSSNQCSFAFTNLNKIYFINELSNTNYAFVSTPVYRDTSAWYHMVVAFDSTQATSADRVKIYVNGEQVTAWDTAVYPAQNWDGIVNSTSYTHYVGKNRSNSSMVMEGYMAEVHFIDGTALDASSFGETKSGVWIPKAYSGSYGTNGFYLDFDGTYYNDKSGNGNNWTANNLAATDVVLDSPTNNFATWNAAWASHDTLSEGNLKTAGNSNWNGVQSTFAASSGKWYWEELVLADNADYNIGIQDTSVTASGDQNSAQGTSVIEVYNYSSGSCRIRHEGSYSTISGSSYAASGDVMGFALDMDSATFKYYRNGTLYHTQSLDSSFANVAPYSAKYHASASHTNFGQDSSFAGNKTAQGNTDANGYGDFYYAPPTGYLALCSNNLTIPDAMNPALDASPQDYFNTVLYTGDGTTSHAITGVGFQPDLLWLKERNSTGYPIMQNSISGVQKELYTNVTNAENSVSNGIQSFDSDGWTVGSDGWQNGSGDSMVAWCWKANGSGVSNTDGSVTSTVSANTDAGFSIVTYTATGSGDITVGHGLNQAPDLIIGKTRNVAYDWRVYHSSLGATQAMALNYTNAASSNTAWGNTAPTSTVFTAGRGGTENMNYASGETIVAYCFHSVSGFSKFGSYTGNNSADGPFVYTGFRPAFILIKDASTTGYWVIYDSVRDTFNAVDEYLQPQSSAAETSLGLENVDLLSNGFKLRATNANSGQNNVSGNTYIYMAFAENPFKYANAR